MLWVVVLPVTGVVFFPTVNLDIGLDVATFPVDTLGNTTRPPGAFGCLTIGVFDRFEIGTIIEFPGLLERWDTA